MPSNRNRLHKNTGKHVPDTLGTEETDARTLSKKTGIPKPEIYRTVKELQEKGLVEKELTIKSKFIATPIQFKLQILINQKGACASRDPSTLFGALLYDARSKKRENVTRVKKHDTFPK